MRSILFLSFVVCILSDCQGVPPPTLRFLNMLIRHGDRTAIYTYPNDPYGLDVWPEGPGQLTQIGIEQHFRLGQYYRKRYDGFINDSYSMFELTVHSSGIDRVLMSAQSNLCGFYGGPIQGGGMPCQPVPIHTRPVLDDNYLAMREDCPMWSKAYNEELHSAAVKAFEKENEGFFSFLAEKSGFPKVTSFNLAQIADPIYTQHVHNYTMPDWANETVIATLMEIFGTGFSFQYKTPKERRLKGGNLLKIMTEHMDAKINGTLDARAKMSMFAGHDSTILALLDTMNLYNGISPPYASSVLIELHEAPPKSFYVNIFYRNDTSKPMPLTLPGCSINCPIAMFKQLTHDAIPGDWEAECQIPVSEKHTVVPVIIG